MRPVSSARFALLEQADAGALFKAMHNGAEEIAGVAALAGLAAADPRMAAVIDLVGPVASRRRAAGFGALLKLILEQQVSTAAAAAMWSKLAATLGEITPAAFLTLDDDALRACGFSRAKVAYGRGLAAEVLEGQLDLDRLPAMADEEAIAELTRLKGIGRWTAEIYLMFCVGRADVWPAGDLALQLAMQRIQGLERRPTAKEMYPLAEPWRPYRSTAALLLWGYYRTVMLAKGQPPDGLA
jgi:DNA-3-methyladenine glycosylase II